MHIQQQFICKSTVQLKKLVKQLAKLEETSYEIARKCYKAITNYRLQKLENNCKNSYKDLINSCKTILPIKYIYKLCWFQEILTVNTVGQLVKVSYNTGKTKSYILVTLYRAITNSFKLVKLGYCNCYHCRRLVSFNS